MRTHGIRTTLLRMEGAGKTARAANMVRFRRGIHPLLSRERTHLSDRGDRAEFRNASPISKHPNCLRGAER